MILLHQGYMPNNSQKTSNMEKPKRKYSNRRKNRKEVVIVDADIESSNDEGTWVDKIKSAPVPVKRKSSKSDPEDDGSEKHFSNTWVLWSHDIISDNWETPEGFDELSLIDSPTTFWKVVNNLTTLGMDCMHFYIMREGIVPIWEYPENIKGGNCSIKFDFSDALSNYEFLSARMVTNTLLEDPTQMDEIYGIAISPKINARNSSAIIKIWNKDYTVDVSKMLSSDIIKKYDGCSIQYRPHDKNVNFRHKQ